MSETNDALELVRRQLNERAQARRAELGIGRARRMHARHRAQLEREIQECGEFVTRRPDGFWRLWPEFRGNWSLAKEAGGDGPRTGYQWSELNRVTCKTWIRRWRRVAWLIRLKGLTRVVLDAQPDDSMDLLTHGLFVRLLAAKDWREMLAKARSVAVELARIREELARLDSPVLPDVQFEMGRYFQRWLWPRIDAALRKREPREPSDSERRFVLARASLEWAVQCRPDLEDDLEQLHTYIKSSGECRVYSGSRVPEFGTWRRYVRQQGPGEHE